MAKRNKAKAEAVVAQKLKAEMDNTDKPAIWTPQRRMEEANAQKLMVIYHILAIYQEHDRERLCPIPLERYSLGELETHLRNLRAGRFPWKAP